MNEFTIQPHVGIGPVALGASRLVARRSLAEAGFPLEHTHGSLDYFCDAAIQVEFDSTDHAQFIGISCHRAYIVTYHGTNVFDVPATELFELIAARDGSGGHYFRATDYFFPSQALSLWDADEQYDRLRRE